MSERERGTAVDVLRERSKSFHWAGRLLSGRHLSDAAELYAFCRHVDDLADDHEPSEAVDLLSQVLYDLEYETSSNPTVDAFLLLCRRKGIDILIPRLLTEALRSDQPPVRIASWDELVRYAYSVASTVGIMMCAVLDVRDERALPFAVDLGIAMQLTNISRDVLEDARMDRMYLPAGAGAPEPADIVAGDAPARAAAFAVLSPLLTKADVYYRSADKGMRFLPFRARLGIITASRLYEAIGLRALRRGDYWSSKTVVPKGRKAVLTAAAVGACLCNPRYWPVGPPPSHDAALHTPLDDLPGSHTAVFGGQ